MPGRKVRANERVRAWLKSKVFEELSENNFHAIHLESLSAQLAGKIEERAQARKTEQELAYKRSADEASMGL